ncbi:ABC transporter substrate-binding protein [Longirhabdus pacifica]|uniref:ABC transporter substrate-binding protein n=1 Tax=Longirhabdus pacifica TaxID=2305227 RepID=UPI0013E8AF99|nr:extracellular solute-binding protein [Longirhabdus pacifica]
MSKKWCWMLPMLLCFVFIMGCSSDEDMSSEAEPVVLKVMVDNRDQFYNDYGKMYLFENQHVEFEIISPYELLQYYYYNDRDSDFDYVGELHEFIEAQQPDILFLDEKDFAILADTNYLFELSSLMENSEFDSDALHDNVLQYIQSYGGGTLYGLTSSFQSSVMYYNKELFDQYDVPYPQDHMTWKQIMDLAAMFPVSQDEEHELYGYQIGGTSGDLSDFILQLGRTHGLTSIDVEAMEITMNTEGWEDVFTLALQASDANLLFIPGEYVEKEHQAGRMVHYMDTEMFLRGKSAMALQSDAYISELNNLKTQWEFWQGELRPIDYDVVTAPVNPSFSDQGGKLEVQQYHAIYANSDHIDQAWDFVSFMNGEKLAKVMAKTTENQLMLRSEYTQIPSAVNKDAFYKLTPPSNENELRQDLLLNSQFRSDFYALWKEEVTALMNNEKTIKEALEAIEERGQDYLDLAVMRSKE